MLLAAVAEFGGGLALGAIGNSDSANRSPFATALMTLTSPLVVLIGLLVAACLLIPGEQLRRGRITANPNPPRALLPKASNVSRFAVLSVGWHALFAALGLVAALALVVVPAIAALTRSWPTTLPADDDFARSWQITGIFALAIAVATLVSLYKKVHYRSVLARHGGEAPAGAGSATWAFVTYRWRLDLWVAALGGLILGFAGVSVGLVHWGSDPDEGSAVVFLVVLVTVAIALIAFGLWLASNFWRAGKPLGAAESYS